MRPLYIFCISVFLLGLLTCAKGISMAHADWVIEPPTDEERIRYKTMIWEGNITDIRWQTSPLSHNRRQIITFTINEVLKGAPIIGERELILSPQRHDDRTEYPDIEIEEGPALLSPRFDREGNLTISWGDNTRWRNGENEIFNRYRARRAELRASIESREANIEDWHIWQDFLLEWDDRLAARVAFKQMQNLDGVTITDWENIADMEYRDSQWEASLEAWRQVLEIDPTNEEATRMANSMLGLLNRPEEIDLSHADLTYFRVGLERRPWIIEDLDVLDFSERDFTGIDFSHAELFLVNFDAANLTGARFTEATSLSNFTGANLTNTDFRMAKFDWRSHPDFSGAIFHGTRFDWADMRNVNFREQILENVTFFGTNLSRADFKNAELHNVSFSGANLRGATLSGLDMRNMNLVNMNFQGTDFTGTDLRNANLSYANANQVSYSTNFTNADLRGAYLLDADLTGAIFDRTSLENALYNCHTIFPEGLEPQMHDMELIGNADCTTISYVYRR